MKRAALHARWQAGGSGLTLMPCELLEDNADKLLALVLQLADAWKLPPAFADWARSDCVWLASLVDRIVHRRDLRTEVARHERVVGFEVVQRRSVGHRSLPRVSSWVGHPRCRGT